MVPKGNHKLLAKHSIKISVIKEECRFSIYKIVDNKVIFLLSILHLISAMHKDESARSRCADAVSNLIRKNEENTFSTDEFKSIVVGDFNLQLYSQGIVGIFEFNATMSIPKAKKIYCEVDGDKHYFYFNPTWRLMGDNKMAQGTYYTDTDQQDMSMFWYSFDEVLIRPYFIDKFN